MRNETSPTEAADAGDAVFPKQVHASTASAAFSELEKGHTEMDHLTRVRGQIQDTPSLPVVTENLSAAEALTAPPVPSEGNDDPTLICSFCSFLCHLGRGPVVRQLCNLCKLDMEGLAHA